jgi:hypothetical protein
MTKENTMFKIHVAALVVASAVLPARAENWKTVDVTRDGAIIEVDLDSTQNNDGGITRALVSGLGMQPVWLMFDCKGHWRMFPRLPLVHIPTGSIVEATAEMVCAK